ncbi:hypothetical protein K505DRAFT_368689 [Melanomma pulvis-pyrius CBS 109.77]|uniref:Thioester reductase (TE) domain-containing protein n=1 Tax=Melanomma pulvis-pyrius CBS 109.77 TaxID=1314802 RepID=A0A6A6WP89_9PLEO|nr:hypothetical protein K505DRAFT_368689 [Melanomma pulvis-pyrius CBS 109.77]
MQTLLAHHSKHLPQPTGKAALPTGRNAVAIIGSTGFLGPHIVACLLQKHAGSRIFCLNRSDDGEQRTVSALRGIMGDSISLSQLRFLVADITEPSFGLEEAQINLLAFEVSEIVFNAWNTNWVLPLKQFRPFLTAIRNTIDFCESSATRIRITFVSSICAVGNWPKEHPMQPIIPEDIVWDSRSAMEHGYGESKCVAEQLLARAHQVSGLPVSIVRIGQIGGPSSPAVGAWPRQGWLYSIIRTSKMLGCFPTHVQPLDWIPVDTLAEGIANVVQGRSEHQAVQVFNLVHPEPVPWRLLFSTLQGKFGLRVDLVSLPEWLARLGAGRSKLYGFLTSLGSGREYDMFFHSGKALEVLPEVVPITEDLLVTWLSGWELGRDGLNSKI